VRKGDARSEMDRLFAEMPGATAPWPLCSSRRPAGGSATTVPAMIRRTKRPRRRPKHTRTEGPYGGGGTSTDGVPRSTRPEANDRSKHDRNPGEPRRTAGDRRYHHVSVATGSKLVFVAGQVAWDADEHRQNRPAGPSELVRRPMWLLRGRPKVNAQPAEPSAGPKTIEDRKGLRVKDTKSTTGARIVLSRSYLAPCPSGPPGRVPR
jgi:enamine deaminase RidA (YjgF/YER057c/UK114 family)